MAPRDRSTGGKGEDVLSPEELDIADDENVATLGGGRYVVGPDGPPNEDKVKEVRSRLASAVETDDADDTSTEADGTSDSRDAESTSNTDTDADSRSLSGREVKTWIDHQLEASDSRYAYRIAAKSGDSIAHQQLSSDDIGMTFDALLMWYSQQVGHGTAVEEVLGILLAESNIRVKYPTRRFLAYLDENDLGPNDTISDLLRSIQNDGGLVFPPTER